VAEHWQWKSYHRCQSDDHENIYPHIDKDEKRKSSGKGFDVVVLFVSPRNVKQVEDKQNIKTNHSNHPLKAKAFTKIGKDKIRRRDRQELKLCLGGILLGFTIHPAASNGNKCLTYLIAWFIEHIVDTLLLVGFESVLIDHRSTCTGKDKQCHPYFPVDPYKKEYAVSGNEQYKRCTKVRLFGNDKKGNDDHQRELDKLKKSVSLLRWRLFADEVGKQHNDIDFNEL